MPEILLLMKLTLQKYLFVVSSSFLFRVCFGRGRLSKYTQMSLTQKVSILLKPFSLSPILHTQQLIHQAAHSACKAVSQKKVFFYLPLYVSKASKNNKKQNFSARLIHSSAQRWEQRKRPYSQQLNSGRAFPSDYLTSKSCSRPYAGSSSGFLFYSRILLSSCSSGFFTVSYQLSHVVRKQLKCTPSTFIPTIKMIS